MIKLLLVDDQAQVRRGLRMNIALQPDLEVVGEAENGANAVSKAVALQPDVVVMDIEMPGMDGLTAARSLRSLLPGCAVVFLTLHDDEALKARARAMGAEFVGKHEPGETLFASIYQAAARSTKSTEFSSQDERD
jgi:DNA-binding NarL/FixJ family response regulator